MSFAHAPVTKGLMLGLGLSSFLASMLDVKYLFHLQISPHISRDHQYWRLLTHHVAFGNSSDLFVAELILFNVSIIVERAFGSLKFASFLVSTTLVSTLSTFISLLISNRFGLGQLPAGPFTMLLAILYQYVRIVPPAYTFKISAVTFSDKMFIYILALQLTISQPPATILLTFLGILAGVLYRTDFIPLKDFRLSPSIHSFSKSYLLPLIGSTVPPRRDNRALPDEIDRYSRRDDVVRTSSSSSVARTAPAPPTSPTTPSTAAAAAPSLPTAPVAPPSALNQWVNELTGRNQLRIPTSAEITQLQGMFPNVPRERIVGALQRNPTVERAVEFLLAAGA